MTRQRFRLLCMTLWLILALAPALTAVYDVSARDLWRRLRHAVTGRQADRPRERGATTDQ